MDCKPQKYMLINCDEANKLVKSINANRAMLLQRELNARTFVSTIKDRDDDRPDYDFKDTQRQLAEMESKILVLKHAINRFNTQTTLPSGLTIDTALVKIAMLSEHKRRLNEMRTLPSKTRISRTAANSLPEYNFTNFDSKKVDAEYRRVEAELISLQTEINTANMRVEISVPDEIAK